MSEFVCGIGPENKDSSAAVELAGFTRDILRGRSTHRQPRARDASGSKGKTTQSDVSSCQNCNFVRHGVLNAVDSDRV
jgi:hypothetical protein